MKPLLILPPAPHRWHAVEPLIRELDPLRRAEIEARLTNGVPDSEDAFSIVTIAGQVVSLAWVAKRRQIGVLGLLFTHPEQRRRGHAKRALDTAASWFDMTGGAWLYAIGPRDAGEPLLSLLGFRTLFGALQPAAAPIAAVRTRGGAAPHPYDAAPLNDVPVEVREITLAEWPDLVALLMHFRGADPRVPLDESAVTADAFALDLLAQQKRGTCRLLAAQRAGRLIGAASVATDQLGDRTYAAMIPADAQIDPLREGVVAAAQAKGYTRVEWPMEVLAATPTTA
jgi:GNAT superfamily N-acetyltransferase